MTSSAALRSLCDAVEQIVARYPDIWSEDATLAFSGGKDSIALAIALSATGRRFRLRAVDMGYSPAWHGRIESLAQAMGLPVEVLAVADIARSSETEPSIRSELALRRAFLESGDSTAPTVSPCTNCFNCKILALAGATRLGSPHILFAHHADDALASFLKSALMYLDRWRDGNEVFDRDRFRRAAMQLAEALRRGAVETVNSLVALIESGCAQTSEPPVEKREIKGHFYSIGRPMFFVQEAVTVEVIRGLGLTAESSGCGHTVAATTRTPREIVHYELIPFVVQSSFGRDALRKLMDAISAGLNVDGTTVVDVRGTRHLALGDQYKGGPNTLADRL